MNISMYWLVAITVSVMLIFAGRLLYHEQLTVSKGIAACLLGLFLINR